MLTLNKVISAQTVLKNIIRETNVVRAYCIGPKIVNEAINVLDKAAELCVMSERRTLVGCKQFDAPTVKFLEKE